MNPTETDSHRATDATDTPAAGPASAPGGGFAVTAAVLGVLSLFVPVLGLLFGAAAVALGLIGLIGRRTRGGLVVLGLVLGTAGVVGQTALTGLMLQGGLLGRFTARRVKCKVNLRCIGQGFALYKACYSDSYPFISNTLGMVYNAPMIAGGSDDVYALDGDPNGQGKKLNMLENLNLLIKEGMATYRVFRCPSVTDKIMDRSIEANGDYGFKDADGKICIDYAYQIGYTTCGPVKGRITDNAAPLTNMNDSVVIMADVNMNKKGKMVRDNKAAFGKNGTGLLAHGTAGINTLDAGGNANWVEGTMLTGYNKNNIYARDLTAKNDDPDGSTDIGVPVNQYDSVLFWGK